MGKSKALVSEKASKKSHKKDEDDELVDLKEEKKDKKRKHKTGDDEYVFPRSYYILAQFYFSLVVNMLILDLIIFQGTYR